MLDQDKDALRQAVRQNYGAIATQAAQEASAARASGCCGEGSSCCGPEGDAPLSPEQVSLVLGYTQDDVTSVPSGANMGLGCGNPQAIASLQPGEVVLDLGSGGGFDCFLAARRVGDAGYVIGVDMTPEMVSKARRNAETTGQKNVEFRLGEIEKLPVADGTVDVILSNCVINLSPDKRSVFEEAYRVLRDGGRLAISDIVATAALPEAVKKDLALYTGCMAGASEIDVLEHMLRDVGFTDIAIMPRDESRELIRSWAPGRALEDVVVSATIQARKAAVVTASCCTPEEQAVCCEPAEKAACCGTAVGETCAC